MACPNKKIVKSYLTFAEYEHLNQIAQRTGRSISGLVRILCLAGEVKTFEHEELKLELIKIRGDLGRLGGLFKAFLSDLGKQLPAERGELNRLLHQIDLRQREIRVKVDIL